MALSDRHIRGLESRKIDVEIATHMGLYSGKRSPDSSVVPDPEGDILCFPYFEDAVEVNTKYRAHQNGQRRLWQRSKAQGAVKTPFNINIVLNDQTRAELEADDTYALIVTEGEFDCITAVQCGFPHAISLPEGAVPDKDQYGRALPPVPDDAKDIVIGEDDKFSFFSRHFEKLSLVRNFIICTDDDGPGRRMGQEMVRRIGAARCLQVHYPPGDVVPDTKRARDADGSVPLRPCKDLNEVLIHFGPEGVRDMLNAAVPWPVKGLYKLSDYPDVEMPVTYETGICKELDRGFRLYDSCFAVVTGPPGFGKALALDTPIPTPTGWSKMGDLGVGDAVLDESGRECRIVAATEVMRGRPCHEVRFATGETLIADADHQWLTISEKARQSLNNRIYRDASGPFKPKGSDQSSKWTAPSVVTTRQIAETLMANGKRNHHVVACRPLPGRVADLPLDPYALGVWLGNGTTTDGSVTSLDDETIARLNLCGLKVEWKQRGLYRVFGLRVILRDMGVLNDKHIPELYLRASVEQRLALLQGLMDTDGHCSLKGHCEYTSIKRRLAEGVLELVRTFGIKATMTFETAKLNGRTISDKHRVLFTTNLPVFSLSRKSVRMPKAPHRCPNHVIVDCRPVESVPVRRIQVDSPSHLFLASRSFIPTHNSLIVNQIAVQMAKLHRWPVCIFSGEMPTKPYLATPLMTAFLNKPRSEWSGDERRRATDFVERYFSFIDYNVRPNEDEAEIDVDFVIQKGTDACFRYGTRLLILDPWNEIEHGARPMNISQTEYIGMAIRKLKRFAKSCGCAVIVVAHPRKLANGETPSLYSIADSASFANKAELGLIVTADDIKHPFRDISVPKVKFEGTGEVSSFKVQWDPRTRLFVPFSSAVITQPSQSEGWKSIS